MMYPDDDKVLVELRKRMHEELMREYRQKRFNDDVIWNDPATKSYETVTRSEVNILKNEIASITKKFNNLETELLRKNAYIEKLCSSLMLIIHDAEKLKELDGLKEQYDKYIMLGRIVYGNDFDEILKGLR